MTLHDSFGLVGTTISGKYQVEDLVAEGGYALVYRAIHKVWQQPVAIKCFKVLGHVREAQRAKLIEEFIQEGALLTELSRRSAAIVQARDVGNFTTREGTWIPYLVLEWLEGRSLEKINESRHGAFTLEGAMAILRPVATALDIVHRKGIAHRDIKPGNIFVLGELGGEDMFVKVLDFGIAKVMQEVGGQFAKTAEGITSFTPLYAAPEQFSRTHGSTGPWTDVFALALVFCELLAGRPALDGDDFLQLGMSSGRPDIRPTPRTRGVNLPDALETVFVKALAVEPQHRYQTAGEFWNAVMHAVDPNSAQLPAPSRRAVLSPPSSRAVVPAEPAASAATLPVYSNMAAPPTAPSVGSAPPAPPRARSKGLLVAAIAAIATAAAALFAVRSQRPDGGTRPMTAMASASASASPAPPPPPTCPSDMAQIPGGKFFMGADDGNADEKPAHQVTLSPFCMDLHEVTTADYEACSNIGECKRAPSDVDWKDITARQRKVYGAFCNARNPERADHPINCVDYDRAVRYCEYKGKRLPTEAEWEFSARGSDGRKYPWGDEEPDATRLNACGAECIAWGAKNGEPMRALYATSDGFEGTAPVGSFPRGASPFGLLDIVGNVWEWTSDWDGSYESFAQIDPKGPKSGTRRVVRGGAFNGGFASWIRPTQRYSDRPDTQSHAYGFRCSKSLNSETDAGAR